MAIHQDPLLVTLGFALFLNLSTQLWRSHISNRFCSLALFACIPHFGQAVIRMLNCLSIDKEINVAFPGSRVTSVQMGQAQKFLMAGTYSINEVRQPFLHFKDSEGVFLGGHWTCLVSQSWYQQSKIIHGIYEKHNFFWLGIPRHQWADQANFDNTCLFFIYIWCYLMSK